MYRVAILGALARCAHAQPWITCGADCDVSFRTMQVERDGVILPHVVQVSHVQFLDALDPRLPVPDREACRALLFGLAHDIAQGLGIHLHHVRLVGQVVVLVLQPSGFLGVHQEADVVKAAPATHGIARPKLELVALRRIQTEVRSFNRSNGPANAHGEVELCEEILVQWAVPHLQDAAALGLTKNVKAFVGVRHRGEVTGPVHACLAALRRAANTAVR
mmetsp:Transcript_11366/g.34246  ORF Transcript_11366/g.34246 Transcript_11366/m.34246 type:complete len:219 (-) Transcript_11366:367-1023(-)